MRARVARRADGPLAPAWGYVLCLAALGLRLGPLWVNRFHPDEALYGTWALKIASGRDVLLAGVAPDKPPVLFYTMAMAFLALGRVEVAARLVGLIAGVASVALVWRLTAIFGPIGSGLAATAMALSPFAVLFSSTAFLDPLMVMFALASLAAVTRGRYGWAGVLLGMAAATKVQALVFFPLVVACAIPGVQPGNLCRQVATALDLDPRVPLRACVFKFAAGLAIPASIVLLWDRLRGGALFWIQQAINYGGIRLVYASEVMPRLAGWASFLPYFFGRPMLIALAAGLPLLLIYDLTRGARTRAAVLDLTLMTFTLGYVFVHWLLAFPVWDRYWLGLVPVACLLIGRLASVLADGLAGRSSRPRMAYLVVAILALVLLIPPAVQAYRSKIPIGGDHGPHDGIDRAAAFLRGFPYGTVIYDHWLGWTLDYYLWDAHAYVAYFATPETLAQDLHVFGRTSPRYIVFPASESTTRVERAIAVEGFGLAPVLSTRDRHGQPTFTVYRIEPYASH